MKIETKNRVPFKSEILDAFQNEQGVKEDVIEYIQKKAVNLFEESLSQALKFRNWFDGDEIEISVSVGIGDPEEDE